MFVVALTVASCAPDPPADHNPATPPPQPGVACLPVAVDEPSLVSVDDGDDCPWTVIADQDVVELRHHLQEGHRSSGQVPSACKGRSCQWQLTRTSAGPAVLATLPGTYGETPRGLWLGVPADQQLVFTPLWMGVHTHVDGADIGPAWWLEPSLCPNAVLVLTPKPRLSVVRGEAPPPELTAQAGAYQISGTGSEAVWVATSASPANCQPLEFDRP